MDRAGFYSFSHIVVLSCEYTRICPFSHRKTLQLSLSSLKLRAVLSLVRVSCSPEWEMLGCRAKFLVYRMRAARCHRLSPARAACCALSRTLRSLQPAFPSERRGRNHISLCTSLITSQCAWLSPCRPLRSTQSIAQFVVF